MLLYLQQSTRRLNAALSKDGCLKALVNFTPMFLSFVLYLGICKSHKCTYTHTQIHTYIHTHIHTVG